MHLTVNYSPQKVPSNIMRLRIVLLFIRNFNGFYGFYAFCGLSHLDWQDYYKQKLIKDSQKCRDANPFHSLKAI